MKKLFLIFMFTFALLGVGCSPSLGYFLVTYKKKEGNECIFGLANKFGDSTEMRKVRPKLYYNKKAMEDSVKMRADWWSGVLFLPRKQK